MYKKFMRKRSWAVLGASWAVLGSAWAVLGAIGGADWGSNLGPGTPQILNLPNVFVDVHTFSIIYNHPQKPNENTRLSGAPEPKFDPKSVQNLPPGVSGVALSFFNGQHTVSQRQPNKTQKKPKQSQPLTDTKDNTNEYN